MCTDGTLGDGVGVSVENDDINGREIGCLCSRRGDGKQGAYMFAKPSTSSFSAVY